jgi:hypothetical protein
MAVECLSGHAKLHAQIYHLRLRLAHGRLGQAHPGGRHFIRAAAVASTGPRGGKPGPGALDDQRALELGQCCEDAEDELAGGGGGVDLGTLPCQHTQAHPARGQLMHGRDEMMQVTAQTVKLPHQPGITLAQRLQAAGKAGPVIPLSP